MVTLARTIDANLPMVFYMYGFLSRHYSSVQTMLTSFTCGHQTCIQVIDLRIFTMPNDLYAAFVEQDSGTTILVSQNIQPASTVNSLCLSW